MRSFAWALLIVLIAIVAVPPANATGGIFARAFAYWDNEMCTSLTNTCSGTARADHYGFVVNPGGTGLLYVDGVLQSSCTFGPEGSCTTTGASYGWTWDNNHIGCHTITAVTILIGGDVDTDTAVTYGC